MKIFKITWYSSIGELRTEYYKNIQTAVDRYVMLEYAADSYPSISEEFLNQE